MMVSAVHNGTPMETLVDAQLPDTLPDTLPANKFLVPGIFTGRRKRTQTCWKDNEDDAEGMALGEHVDGRCPDDSGRTRPAPGRSWGQVGARNRRKAKRGKMCYLEDDSEAYMSNSESCASSATSDKPAAETLNIKSNSNIFFTVDAKERCYQSGSGKTYYKPLKDVHQRAERFKQVRDETILRSWVSDEEADALEEFFKRSMEPHKRIVELQLDLDPSPSEYDRRKLE